MAILPRPPSTWQADFSQQYAYHERLYKARFRFLTPELREENIQEALVQTARYYESQWRLHGQRVENRWSIARCVLSRVKRGRSCTRGFRNADPLDRTYRKSGPKRENCRHTIGKALAGVEARAEISPDLRTDLESWLQALPAPQRELALSFAAGESAESIAKREGMAVASVQRLRSQLSESFAAYRDYGVPPRQAPQIVGRASGRLADLRDWLRSQTPRVRRAVAEKYAGAPTARTGAALPLAAR